MVPGDANGTGFQMARIAPIEVNIPGADNQIYNVIDQRVGYDFPTSQIEVNVPRLSVAEGSLVNIPVKVLTNGQGVASLQFGLGYDPALLNFLGIEATSAASKWLTYINANNNQIDWGGYDNSNVQHPLYNGDEIITLQFVALQPQAQWGGSPLWTTNKFAGDMASRDLSITPTNGVIQVMRVSQNGVRLDDNTMVVSPNPTLGPIEIQFRVTKTSNVNLSIFDQYGRTFVKITEGKFPAGDFLYNSDLGQVSEGVYFVSLTLDNNKVVTKKVIKKQ
jgi:hypothetical protein